MGAGTIPSTEYVELFNITPGSIKEQNEHLLHIIDTLISSRTTKQSPLG